MENVIIFGLALLAVVVVAIYVGRQNAKADRKISKVYGTAIYMEACNLEYFIRNCTFTPGNRKYIEDKLKEYRARDEMEDHVFNNLIGGIACTFENRCAIEDVKAKL